LGDQYVQGTQCWSGIATNIMYGQIHTPNDQTLTSFQGCVMNWWIFFHYQKWYILLNFNYFNALKELLVWWVEEMKAHANDWMATYHGNEQYLEEFDWWLP
jgi:hypothetical protein